MCSYFLMLGREATNTNLIVFDWTRMRLDTVLVEKIQNKVIWIQYT